MKRRELVKYSRKSAKKPLPPPGYASNKDAILRLWRTSSLIYMMLGGCWFDTVKDHVGIEKALEWEREVWLKRGSMLYLTSDGFAHQNDFDNAKYGKKRLRQMFRDIFSLSMEAQKMALVEDLNEHMGGEEQRDDITLLGVRI